jgi:hypothetical protein
MEKMHAKIQAFMDMNCTNLKKRVPQHPSICFWQRVYSIKKIRSMMENMVRMIVDGKACVVTMDIGGKAVNRHSLFTMGTQKMVIK